MAQRPPSGVSFSRDVTLFEGQGRALTHLLAGFDDDARWILLIGPEGSGKTVILQALRAELKSTGAEVVACDGLEAVEPHDLIVALRNRLFLPTPRGKGFSRKDLAETIVASRRGQGKPLLILMDNAHELSSRSLRLLSEIVRKTTAEAGGAWAVLVGRPELEEPALRTAGKLKRVLCSPGALTAEEVGAHVDHRIHVGPDRAVSIPPDAVDQIARFTGGMPGRIEALCELIVRTPAVRLSNEVSVEVVEDAAEKLGVHRRRRDASNTEGEEIPWRRYAAIGAAAIAALALTGSGIYYGRPLVAAGRDALTAWFGTPAPPPAAPAAESAASRRESAAAPTAAAGARATAAIPARPAPAAQPAKPAPPPVSAEQIAALIDGARTGRAEDVAWLLGTGVPAEVRDVGGATPLMHATIQGHLDAARVLLDKGAQVNGRDRGGITPAMLAVIYDRPDALRLLLARGADVNVRSGSGWTALTFAAWKGDPDLVRTLLDHGASRKVVDKQGWTPLDYATAALQTPSTDVDPGDGPARPPQGGRHAEVVPLLQSAR